MSARALLVGLPETGKSTYLVALYHLLETSEMALRKRWLRFQNTERTSRDTNAEVSMTLSAKGQELRLLIPDLAGETYERCLTERQWPASLGEAIRESTGFLLFIHSRMVKEPVRINQVMAIAGDLIDDPDEGSTTPQPFKYEQVGTQVLLVDMVQLIEQARSGEPFKLALIISAYDLVAPLQTTLKDLPSDKLPPTWLKNTMPLLDQYLRCNMQDRLRIFGVSAQGGDLQKKEDLQLLTAPIGASERVWIIEDGRKHADLTAPVRWLLDLEATRRADD
jgi:hypothetical protein